MTNMPSGARPTQASWFEDPVMKKWYRMSEDEVGRGAQGRVIKCRDRSNDVSVLKMCVRMWVRSSRVRAQDPQQRDSQEGWRSDARVAQGHWGTTVLSDPGTSPAAADPPPSRR